MGIYVIKNKKNDKKYIGQTRDLEERRRGHLYASRIGGNNTYLYKAIRKYGIDNFEFEVIEFCKEEDLDRREIYWIEKLGTFGGGYNLTYGGTNGSSKISGDIYKLIAKDLKETNMTTEEIGDKHGIARETVSRINVGSRNKREGYEYPIREKIKEDKQLRECINCKKETKRGASKRCQECHFKEISKHIPSREYLLKNVALKGFEQVGRDHNVSGNAVTKWCKKRGLPHRIKEIKYLYENGEELKSKHNKKGSGYEWKDVEIESPEGVKSVFKNIEDTIKYLEKEIKGKIVRRDYITRVLNGEFNTYLGYKFKGRK